LIAPNIIVQAVTIAQFNGFADKNLPVWTVLSSYGSEMFIA